MSKTSGVEVLCDHCEKPIPFGKPEAIFVTLRGPEVGHVKADCCDNLCFAAWAYNRLVQVGPSERTEP